MFSFWHSGECSKRFRGMFEKTPGNIREDSGECSKKNSIEYSRGLLLKIRGMFQRIPPNARADSGERLG